MHITDIFCIESGSPRLDLARIAHYVDVIVLESELIILLDHGYDLCHLFIVKGAVK